MAQGAKSSMGEESNLKALMLLWAFLVIVVSLHTTYATVREDELLGGANYLPCDQCSLPEHEYPNEGRMACYSVKRVNKTIQTYVQQCNSTECDDDVFDPFCVKQKCKYVLKNISVPDCKLIQKTSFQEIYFIQDSFRIIYQINTPRYFGYNGYPNNTYCIWNVADEGFVTYRIIDQQLQEPSDCDGPGCDCPDSVTITSGASETKVCGSAIPSLIDQLSPNGLQMKFCSDNMLSRKGVLILAFVHQTLSVSGSCTITPINPTNLSKTVACWGLPNGTKNVTILCNCGYDFMLTTGWYDSDGFQIVTTESSDYVDGSPYYITDGINVTLVIPTFTDAYDGTYTCEKRISGNQVGDTSTTVTLTIAGTPCIDDEDMSLPPSVENGAIKVKIGATVYTVKGLNVAIVCNVTGDPPISISWLKNDHEQLGDLRNMSTLIVTNARDGDNFTCIAENHIGSDRSFSQIFFVHMHKEKFCINL